jgi:hypothetical protein
VSEAGASIADLEAEVAAGSLDPARLEVATEELVAEVVGAQAAAGLDLVTDGQVRWPDLGAAILGALGQGDTGDDGLLARTWRATAALSDRVTAQAVPGPYSLGRRVHERLDPGRRTGFTHELADRLAGELAALATAGCQLVEVEEPAAIGIGRDGDEDVNEAERALFASAQARLLADASGLHAMLVIAGGSACEAGAPTILDAPYQSYLLDLIEGPDNWYLARAVPGDRGIVCGALRPESVADQAPELVWAARYAASSNGRGPERVGLANGTPLVGQDPRSVRRAVDALVRATRLAPLPPEQAVAEGLDQRAFRNPSDPPIGARRGRSPKGR